MSRTRRPFVAVIEDHADTLSMLQLLLEADFTVIAFDSPESALIGLAGKAPDLLVIDIGMPNIDGEELLASLKSSMPGIRAVAFTGYCHPQQVKNVSAFDAVINKPEIDSLLKQIYGLTAWAEKKAS